MEKTTYLLGVKIVKNLSFGPHIEKATLKALKPRERLERIVPNMGRPREKKRKLLPIKNWAKAMEKETYKRRM